MRIRTWPGNVFGGFPNICQTADERGFLSTPNIEFNKYFLWCVLFATKEIVPPPPMFNAVQAGVESVHVINIVQMNNNIVSPLYSPVHIIRMARMNNNSARVMMGNYSLCTLPTIRWSEWKWRWIGWWWSWWTWLCCCCSGEGCETETLIVQILF